MAFTITLSPYDLRFECEPDESILEAGLRQGFNLRFGCKHGGCGSCKSRVVDGEVDLEGCSSFALMDFEREEGYALLCSTSPITDLTLDASDYTEAELRDARDPTLP